MCVWNSCDFGDFNLPADVSMILLTLLFLLVPLLAVHLFTDSVGTITEKKSLKNSQLKNTTDMNENCKRRV